MPSCTSRSPLPHRRRSGAASHCAALRELRSLPWPLLPPTRSRTSLRPFDTKSTGADEGLSAGPRDLAHLLRFYVDPPRAMSRRLGTAAQEEARARRPGPRPGRQPLSSLARSAPYFLSVSFSDFAWSRWACAVGYVSAAH